MSEQQYETKRYVHSPIVIDHNGIHASIQSNGKVNLTKLIPAHDGEDDEYDEIEIPASLIFRLARLLKDTRREESGVK